MSRDDFTVATKNTLRDRVGNLCSNPHCRRLTTGPKSGSCGAINMGTASHICAASRGGPRYDRSMTSEERKSLDNGIWLCNFCADLIDKDEKRYTVSLLHQWKDSAEKNAEYQIHGARDIYTANIQYVNCFCETLFLHNTYPDSKVNLRNLFVMPGYRDKTNCDKESPMKTDLQKRIHDFIEGDKALMVVSGSGGLGKTTLVSWMNYHYAANDTVGHELFGDKKLITIRLRDLDKDLISKKNSLIPALLNYMQIMSMDEFEKRYPDSVIVLDGFDELCMIESLSTPQNLIYDLASKLMKKYKCIITSRPQYIDKGIDIPNDYIVLQHFDKTQIEQWIEKYTSKEYCHEEMDERIIEYILSTGESSISTVCNTPMNLYMLASKKADDALLTNGWTLYRQIFFNELSETEYNAMFPSPYRNYEHDIIVLRDVLYQISEEIAYRMYKNRNSKLYINESELDEIIGMLCERIPILKKANMKDISAQCYALCCYWKENTERGAVEFLHNDIRDFFLAEKIYREMEMLFGKERKGNVEHMAITEKLCELFQYGAIDTKVTEFLWLRSKHNCENEVVDFASVEFNRESFCKLISLMTSNGEVYSNTFHTNQKTAPFELISNVISCTIQVFRHVLEPYCGDNHFISIGDWSSFEFWFKKAFCHVPVTLSSDSMLTLASKWNFSSIRLDGMDLRNIGFQQSLFCNSCLSNAIISGCDFSGCNMTNCDFSDSDAHYASFLNARLEGCDFSGTDLRGTDLPDGFCSPIQHEQVEHLKKLNIHGLKIDR